MRIVLFASGEFALPTLAALCEPPHRDRHQVAVVVTQPDRPSGRGRARTPTPVHVHAGRLGLPTIATANVNDAAIIAELAQYDADLGLVIAFGQKITRPVRELFAHQCVNLHASLLPAYRGAAPYQWAIINGEPRTGVTVFRLVDRMDAGPVFAQRETSILPYERAAELHDRLSLIGVDAVLETLDRLERDPATNPVPQNDDHATRARKLSKKDSHIRFDAPAQQVVNRINGLWSWPGATCDYVPRTGPPTRVTIAHARVAHPPDAHTPIDPDSTAVTDHRADTAIVDASITNTPVPDSSIADSSIRAATVRERSAPGMFDDALHAATADGWIEILEIKPQGGKLMSFRDFVNGRHVRPGDRLAAIES